jgi:hypothetical protein
LTHYTQKLCDVAGYQFDALDYCIKHLCVDANEYGSDKDSLTDFLEKLSTMRSEGLVGEWNMTQVTKDHKPYLALQLQSIWPLFESRYQVNYSRQSIESLIRDRDGLVGTNQRFVKSKDCWKDYERALNQAEMSTSDANFEPKRPKKTSVAKCALIPADVVAAVIGTADQPTNEAIESNYSNYSSPSWEPIEVKPEVHEPVKPEGVTPGTIAVMASDRPESGLMAGCQVVVKSINLDEISNSWFAVVESVESSDESPTSVWFSEIRIP